MVRILLIANDSLLADGIEAALTKEADLEVLRFNHFDPYQVEQTIRSQDLEVIIVEEGEMDEQIFSLSKLVKRYARSLIITISPKKNKIHICESYKTHSSGLTELIQMIKTFRRQP